MTGRLLLCGSMLGLAADKIRGHVEVRRTERWHALLTDVLIHSAYYLPGIHCVPGSVLGAECSGVSHTDPGSAVVKSANEWGDRQMNEQRYQGVTPQCAVL